MIEKFHIAFTTLIIITTVFFLVQKVLMSKLEFSMLKNKRWFSENSSNQFEPTYISDCIVAIVVASIYFAVSWFDLLSISQKKIDTIFTSLGSLYFFFRMYSYSINLDKKIPKSSDTQMDVIPLEPKSIYEYIKKANIYVILTISTLGIIALVIKALFYNGLVATPVIFIIVYGLCFFVIRTLLKDKRHGNKERFEKRRNMIISYILIFIMLLTVTTFVITLNGYFYDLPAKRASIKYLVKGIFMVITLAAYFKVESRTLFAKKNPQLV